MHANKATTIRLLKTVRGQLDGLVKMCEEDRDCIEISNQILASLSILKKVNFDILKGHFNHCIKEAVKTGSSDCEDKIEQVIAILNKLIK